MSGNTDQMCYVQCLSCRLSLNCKVPWRGVADDTDNDNSIQGKCHNETSRTQGICATRITTKLNVCMNVFKKKLNY